MKQQGHEAKASQPAPDLLRLTNGLVTRDFLLQVPTLSQLPQNVVLVVKSLSIKIVSSLHLQHGTCTAPRRIPRFCEHFLRRLVSLSKHQGKRCTTCHSPIRCIDFIFSQHIHFPANHKFRKAVNVTVGGVEGGDARGYLNRTGLRERLRPLKGHSLTFVSYSVKNIR